MIDLDVAEFHIRVIETAGGKLVPVNVAMMRELITRLRQTEKDASRYRWLRDYHIGNYPENINLDGRGSLDDAIDEAMQCNK